MATVNITVENDADFYRTFQYVMGSSGTPIDITGATMEMMLRRHAEDTEAVLRLATDTGEIAITSATQGLFTVYIAQIVLERLGLGSFDHSNIMSRGGLKTRIWNGTLTNNAGPTR
jgi:predicted RNA methylase